MIVVACWAQKNEPIEQRRISGAWRGIHNGSTEATSRLNKVVDPHVLPREVGSLHVGPVACRGHIKGSRCNSSNWKFG